MTPANEILNASMPVQQAPGGAGTIQNVAIAPCILGVTFSESDWMVFEAEAKFAHSFAAFLALPAGRERQCSQSAADATAASQLVELAHVEARRVTACVPEYAHRRGRGASAS
jgi:hypothetical protein